MSRADSGLAHRLATLPLRSKFETRGLVLYVVLGAIVVTFTHAVEEGFPGGKALLREFQKSGAWPASLHQQALWDGRDPMLRRRRLRCMS